MKKSFKDSLKHVECFNEVSYRMNDCVMRVISEVDKKYKNYSSDEKKLIMEGANLVLVQIQKEINMVSYYLKHNENLEDNK